MFPWPVRSGWNIARHTRRPPSRNRNNGIDGMEVGLSYLTVVGLHTKPMICHTGYSLSCFGEEHHIKMRARTVDIRTQTSSSGSMEHGKPISATDNPLVDFDAVCQKVRAAVEPARAHAVSLHDEHGDVLWLSESSMGPDEHNAVREATEAFSNPGAPPEW